MKRGKKKKRAGDVIMGICVDCQRPSFARDEYIVRSSIWMQCGMGAWDAGYLHWECLEKRLGRELTDDDLLVQVVGESRATVEIEVHPDYFTSSEYRPSRPLAPGETVDVDTRNCLAPHETGLFRRVETDQ